MGACRTTALCVKDEDLPAGSVRVPACATAADNSTTAASRQLLQGLSLRLLHDQLLSSQQIQTHV